MAPPSNPSKRKSRGGDSGVKESAASSTGKGDAARQQGMNSRSDRRRIRSPSPESLLGDRELEVDGRSNVTTVVPGGEGGESLLKKRFKRSSLSGSSLAEDSGLAVASTPIRSPSSTPSASSSHKSKMSKSGGSHKKSSKKGAGDLVKVSAPNFDDSEGILVELPQSVVDAKRLPGSKGLVFMRGDRLRVKVLDLKVKRIQAKDAIMSPWGQPGFEKASRKGRINWKDLPEHVQLSLRSAKELLADACKLDAMDIFGTPVDEEEVPGYHSVIKNPMDLSTVRRKLEDLEYETLADMESDMVLCFDNAMTFNPPENMVHEEAAKLQVDVDKFFRKAEECLAVGVSYSAENHRDVLKKEKERLQAEIRREYRDIQETQARLRRLEDQKRRRSTASVVSPGSSATSAAPSSSTPQPSSGAGSSSSSRKLVTVISGDEKIVNQVKEELRLPSQYEAALLEVVDNLERADVHGLFAKPVTEDIAPNYFRVITTPMDLSTLRKRVMSRGYDFIFEFEGDCLLIFSNCCRYNPANNPIHQEALRIKKLVGPWFRKARKQLSIWDNGTLERRYGVSIDQETGHILLRGSRGAEEDTDEDMEVDNEEEDEGRDAEEGEEDDGYEYDDEEDGAMSAEEEGERLSFPGGVYLTAKCVRDAKPSRIQKSVVDAMMDMLDRIKKQPFSRPFGQPFKRSKYPEYFERFSISPGFSIIRRRVPQLNFRTIQDLHANIQTIPQNALAFFPPSSNMYRAAQKLKCFIDLLYSNMKSLYADYDLFGGPKRLPYAEGSQLVTLPEKSASDRVPDTCPPLQHNFHASSIGGWGYVIRYIHAEVKRLDRDNLLLRKPADPKFLEKTPSGLDWNIMETRILSDFYQDTNQYQRDLWNLCRGFSNFFTLFSPESRAAELVWSKGCKRIESILDSIHRKMGRSPHRNLSKLFSSRLRLVLDQKSCNSILTGELFGERDMETLTEKYFSSRKKGGPTFRSPGVTSASGAAVRFTDYSQSPFPQHTVSSPSDQPAQHSASRPRTVVRLDQMPPLPTPGGKGQLSEGKALQTVSRSKAKLQRLRKEQQQNPFSEVDETTARRQLSILDGHILKVKSSRKQVIAELEEKLRVLQEGLGLQEESAPDQQQLETEMSDLRSSIEQTKRDTKSRLESLQSQKNEWEAWLAKFLAYQEYLREKSRHEVREHLAHRQGLTRKDVRAFKSKKVGAFIKEHDLDGTFRLVAALGSSKLAPSGEDMDLNVLADVLRISPSGLESGASEEDGSYDMTEDIDALVSLGDVMRSRVSELLCQDVRHPTTYAILGRRSVVVAETESFFSRLASVVPPRAFLNGILPPGKPFQAQEEPSLPQEEPSVVQGESSSVSGESSSVQGELSSVPGESSSVQGELSSVQGELSAPREEPSGPQEEQVFREGDGPSSVIAQGMDVD